MNFIDEIKQSKIKQFWSKQLPSDLEIVNLEKDLNIKLPESYKSFLKNFGCGSLGHTEIYGLGCPATGIPNIRFVIKALAEQKQFFPENLIPISDADEGFFTCLVCADFDKWKYGNIVVCRPMSNKNISASNIQLIASSFDKFCEIELDSQNKN